MSQTQSTVTISPYVAAAIIEHGKRRGVAAGYILGERASDEVRIVDYFPLTHVESLNDVKTDVYKHEVTRRQRTKRLFTTARVLGWYSAGNCSPDITPEQFRTWCENPAVCFVNSTAIHVHCALPEQGSLSITWAAERMITRKVESKNKYDFQTRREATMPVVVSAMGDIPTNVVLDHVATMALYGGKRPYPTSDLLNMDIVAFRAAKLPPSRPPQQQQPGKEEALLPRPMEDALIRVHNRLAKAIKNAKSGNAATSAEEKKAYEEILSQLAAIRETKEAEGEQEDQYMSSREDISTQRFKDALMIKCTALMLRRDVRQIEYLAQDNNNRGSKNPNNQNQGNNNRDPRTN